MYRIELTPGEEALFKSVDEMALAIQNGVLGSHARIWHAASDKWLPIDFHPHYKLAREKAASGAAHPAPRPAAPRAAMAPAPMRAAVPAAVPTPAPPAESRAERNSREVALLDPASLPPIPKVPELIVVHDGYDEVAPGSSSSPVAPIFPPVAGALAPETPRVAPEPLPDHDRIDLGAPPRLNPRTLGIAGLCAVLVAGGLFLLVRHQPVAAAAPRQVAVRTLPAQEPASYQTSVAASSPTLPVPEHFGPAETDPRPASSRDPVPPPSPADSSAVIPAAPSMSLGTMGSLAGQSDDQMAPAALGARYAAAHSAAQTELEGQFRAAGIGSLFAGTRLASGSVASTRIALAAAGNFVQGFRRRDARIEHAYRDSASTAHWSAKQRAEWTAEASMGESPAAARSADGLLSDMDALLGILADQQGGYEVSAGTISFRDSTAARRYADVRQRIASRMALGDSGAAVLASLVRVIGAPPPVVN